MSFFASLDFFDALIGSSGDPHRTGIGFGLKALARGRRLGYSAWSSVKIASDSFQAETSSR